MRTAADRAARLERSRFYARITAARRKAAAQGAAVNDLTVDDWYEVLAEHGRRCFYCHVDCDAVWIDHVVPVCAGGDNTKRNVVPSCESCNRRKGRKSLEQFINNLCSKGHPLVGDNLYVTPLGSPTCRECHRVWSLEYGQRTGRRAMA